MRERESAQLSFADTVVSQLGGKRTQALLNQLDASIDWESLAKPIRAVYRNADGGAPAEPVVMMIKIVLLQKWFNLSDPQAEEQLNDRVSFRRFVGLRGQEAAPDETTIVVFRGRLREADLDRKLFEIVKRSIEQRGLLMKEGTLVDALILEAPKGRKTGEKDESGHDLTTRDPEASFTQKHGRSYHGYKGHVAADRSGIVTDFEFSTASHHDSRYIDELAKKEKRAVIADAAYAEKDRRRRLERKGVTDGIAHKRQRGQKELPPLLRKINRAIASIRSRVEHSGRGTAESVATALILR
jgi:IS5 family transposase